MSNSVAQSELKRLRQAVLQNEVQLDELNNRIHDLQQKRNALQTRIDNQREALQRLARWI